MGWRSLITLKALTTPDRRHRRGRHQSSEHFAASRIGTTATAGSATPLHALLAQMGGTLTRRRPGGVADIMPSPRPGGLQIMLRVGGERRLDEFELPGFRYEEQQTVRIGNAL